MSKDIWFISDSHFGHENILKFTRYDGSPLRPFKTIEEMDETLIENWNKVVKPEDKIYHLGDVTMKDKYLKLLARCNGHKRLVRGNHDIFKSKMYMHYFDEIYGVRVLENIIFTHIPVHPDCINKRWLGNAHGHLHANVMKDSFGQIDYRYLNVCVEHTEYTPIHLETIVKIFKDRE